MIYTFNIQGQISFSGLASKSAYEVLTIILFSYFLSSRFKTFVQNIIPKQNETLSIFRKISAYPCIHDGVFFYLVQYFSLPFFLFALFLFANDLVFTVWQAFCFDLDMSSSLFLSVGTSNRVKFPTIKSANHHYWYFFPFDIIYIDSNLHYQTCYHTCASLCKCYSMQDSKPVIIFQNN